MKTYPKRLIYLILIPLYFIGVPFFMFIEVVKGFTFYYFKTLENIEDWINKK